MANGVRHRQVLLRYFRGDCVRVLNALSGLGLGIAGGELRDEAVVVCLRLLVEDLGFTVRRLVDEVAVQEPEGSVADLLGFTLDLLAKLLGERGVRVVALAVQQRGITTVAVVAAAAASPAHRPWPTARTHTPLSHCP